MAWNLRGRGWGGPKIPPRTDNRWGDIPFTYLLDSSSQLVSLEEEDEHHLVHLLTLSERRGGEGSGGEGRGGEGRGGEGRGGGEDNYMLKYVVCLLCCVLYL